MEWKNKELNNSHIKTIFCPSFTELFIISEILKTSSSELGAQNVFYESNGAFTGDVSAEMIKSLGVDYVILGHSERRENFTETNEELKQKVDISLKNGLKVIFCCGESLSQRENEVHFDWMRFDCDTPLSL